jgi:cyclohexadienyl dehydratase
MRPGVGALAALAAVALAAAAARPDGVLRVGTSGDYPPFSADGDGFDVEVARRFAAEQGWRVEWVSFRWPELRSDLAAGRFDVAMSGVTWRPERDVLGWMTRAVVSTGPCVLGSAEPERVGVNRGGVLERWARQRFPQAGILAVDDNRTLSDRLAAGEVDAVVTERFELAHLPRDGWSASCAPAADRKVYWVGPARAETLGPRLDAWLREREPELASLRGEWLGDPSPRGELDHLVDLLARRLALMPAVADAKRARGLPVQDAEREARVLARARAQAAASGLDPASVEAFFAVQIALARALQARATPGEPALDLDRELRPAISRVGQRTVEALGRAAPIDAAALRRVDVAPLEAWLDPAELAALRAALLAVQRTGDPAGAAVR